MSIDILFEKILGSLRSAVVGDAMGAATETMSRYEIMSKFGGKVTQLKEPLVDNPFAGGRKVGQVTDDSGLLLAICNSIIDAKGEVTPEVIARNIVKWANNNPDEYGRFAGPTTKEAIRLLKEGKDPLTVGKSGKLPDVGASDGAAMKISPAGLIHPGDVSEAIKDAVIICLPTHATQLAISGACAISAGIAEALSQKSNPFSVVQACMHGASEGEKIGAVKGRVVAGPSVIQRIKLAISIVLTSSDFWNSIEQLGDLIGSGIHISEAVPTAIGIFLASRGDPKLSILGGANIGGDTDTIATIAGSLAGALSGTSTLPEDWYRTVETVNHINIEKIATDLVYIAKKNQKNNEKV